MYSKNVVPLHFQSAWIFFSVQYGAVETYPLILLVLHYKCRLWKHGRRVAVFLQQIQIWYFQPYGEHPLWGHFLLVVL